LKIKKKTDETQLSNAQRINKFLNLFLHIDCLVAVCQPFIKLLLTYLLTYLLLANGISYMVGLLSIAV